ELLAPRHPPRPARPGAAALLHRLFTDTAAHRADHPAVVAAGGQLTYGELEARANQIAHWLLAHGAGAGKCVALLLDRSLEYAVATLAALKSGSAFVPLDPEWPEERQALVLRD